MLIPTDGIVCGLVGGAVAYTLNTSRPPNPQHLRKLLGRRLDGFADVAPERLDAEMVSAVQATRRGWWRVASILVIALYGALGIQLMRSLQLWLPEVPHLLCSALAGLTMGLCFSPMRLVLRQIILYRLHSSRRLNVG